MSTEQTLARRRQNPTHDAQDAGGTDGKPGVIDKFLGAVETVGNKLPEPFTIFLIPVSYTHLTLPTILLV